VASGERDGGCAEVLRVGRGRRWTDPVQAGGLGSGERAGGRVEVLRRARMTIGPRATWEIWRTSWRSCGDATAGEVGDGADPARVAGGARAVFFLWGEPLCAERAHHLDASGRPRASRRPGARSALKKL
jgi:hypothetical protein